MSHCYDKYRLDVAIFTKLMMDRFNVPDGYRLQLTCGATGALDAALSFFASGQSVAMMTYEYFDMVRAVPARGLRLMQMVGGEKNDTEGFIDHIGKTSPDVCYLSLPNNPLGQRYSSEDVARLLEAMHGRWVIIDQTLVTSSPLPLSWFVENAKGAQLLFVGSFSKSHGLVSERIGYLVAPEAVLNTGIYTHAPSGSSIKAATRSTGNGHLQRTLKRISKNNVRLLNWSAHRSWCTWDGSLTNFGVMRFSSEISDRIITAVSTNWSFMSAVSVNRECVRIDLTAPNKKINDMLRYIEVLYAGDGP